MPAPSRPRRAFTAIEMVAVLFLAALASGLAVVSLGSLRGTAAASNVIDRIGYFDGLTRQTARRAHLPVRLVIDPRENQIRTATGADAADQAAQRVLYQPPEGWRIERSVSAVGEEAPDALSIPISASGASASYALQLLCGDSTRWVVVLGLSGQVIEAADETKALEMLYATAPRGNDAD